MSESHWEESGGNYTLSWGGGAWTIRFDGPEPGLRSKLGDWAASLLCLHGLAAAGRSETQVFTPATMVTVESYRSSLQATFAPPGWDGLTVRAAWSPSCGSSGVDLEVQASATSVGLLRDVEVMVQSEWRRALASDSSTRLARRITPRDARAAAFSQDGREAAALLHSMTILPISERPQIHVFTPPGVAAGMHYVEMVKPNDAARLIRVESTEPKLMDQSTLVVRHGLFGHDFEKGVVFRARLRACWFQSSDDAKNADSLYREFVAEPPPLGP